MFGLVTLLKYTQRQ